MKDSKYKFSPITVVLHWVLGFAMLYMLFVGLYMTGLDNGAAKWGYYSLHKSVGVILFVLAVLRIWWRYLNRLPKPLSSSPEWQEQIASIVHIMLLISTVLLPLSGFIMSVSGGFPVAAFGFELVGESSDKVEWLANVAHTVHSVSSYAVMAIVFLHVAGALKRSVINRDGTISRMVGITQG